MAAREPEARLAFLSRKQRAPARTGSKEDAPSFTEGNPGPQSGGLLQVCRKD